MSSRLLFFIDHAETHDTPIIDERRLDAHRHLAEQLILAADGQGVVVDKIVIVANKADIWQSDVTVAARMSEIVREIRDKFLESPNYRIVSVQERHSNESTYDIAKLLQEVA